MSHPILHLHITDTSDGVPAWPDLLDRADDLLTTTEIDVTGLSNASTEHKPVVAFRFNLSDGRVIIAQTSLALLLTAADAMKAKFGDPRT